LRPNCEVCNFERVLLSASINLFDGEELLAAQLRCLRPHVEHLTVVYQTISNRGAAAVVDLEGLLSTYRRDGWLDEVCWYRPESPASPREHEHAKRRLGLRLACARGATHFMSLDVDEFYCAGPLSAARRHIERGGFDGTACRFVDYHARPIYQRTELARFDDENVFVPFIFSVAAAQRPTAPSFFRLFDPTRALPCERPYAFSPDELVMHHMTSVRRDRASLIRKFANSSTEWKLETPERLADLVLGFDPAKHHAPAVRVVDNQFGIELGTHPGSTTP